MCHLKVGDSLQSSSYFFVSLYTGWKVSVHTWLWAKCLDGQWDLPKELNLMYIMVCPAFLLVLKCLIVSHCPLYPLRCGNNDFQVKFERYVIPFLLGPPNWYR